MKGKKILLYTPLIEYNLQHGVRLTAVHQLIEYKPGMPFSWFPETVANARHEVDKDPLKKQLSDVAMVEDLGRHKSTTFTSKERSVDKALSFPLFYNLEGIGRAYEIKELK